MKRIRPVCRATFFVLAIGFFACACQNGESQTADGDILESAENERQDAETSDSLERIEEREEEKEVFYTYGAPCNPSVDYSQSCARLESESRYAPFVCDPLSHILLEGESISVNFASTCDYFYCIHGLRIKGLRTQSELCTVPGANDNFCARCNAKGECVSVFATDGDAEADTEIDRDAIALGDPCDPKLDYQLSCDYTLYPAYTPMACDSTTHRLVLGQERPIVENPDYSSCLQAKCVDGWLEVDKQPVTTPCSLNMQYSYDMIGQIEPGYGCDENAHCTPRAPIKIGDVCDPKLDYSWACETKSYDTSWRIGLLHCESNSCDAKQGVIVPGDKSVHDKDSFFPCTQRICQDGWQRNLPLTHNEPCDLDPGYYKCGTGLIPGWGCNALGKCRPLEVDGDQDEAAEPSEAPVLGAPCLETPDALKFCSRTYDDEGYPYWVPVGYYYFSCDPIRHVYVEDCCVRNTACRAYSCENNRPVQSVLRNGESCDPDLDDDRSSKYYECNAQGECVFKTAIDGDQSETEQESADLRKGKHPCGEKRRKILSNNR